jgi:phosphate-selective porin OprO/OprP
VLASPLVARAQATHPPAAVAQEAELAAPLPKDEGFQWDFSWKNWEGLSYYAVQPTKFKGKYEAVPLLDLEQFKFAGTLGGRLELDGASYGTNGSLFGFDDGFELRRARITAKGASILGVPFRYRVDLGYVPGNFTVTQAYIVIPGIRYIGNVQFGQFTPPVGLQMLTSSWDIPFMEPAAALQALAPPSQLGLQASSPFAEQRGTYAFGGSAGAGGSSEYGSGAKSFGALMGRLSWLAMDGVNSERPAANQYLHVGISGNLQGAAHGQVRYRTRPESYLAPFVLDTGKLAASQATTVDAELLWVNGPFSAQGELISSSLDTERDGSLNFRGFYALASWFLTGESRSYDRSAGTPGRLKPQRDFGFGPDAGWGALEVAVRYSSTDLNDGAVHGGRLSMIIGTLNWTLRPQLKCMFELGTGRVSGAANVSGNGSFVLGQLRLGAYFY